MAGPASRVDSMLLSRVGQLASGSAGTHGRVRAVVEGVFVMFEMFEMFMTNIGLRSQSVPTPYDVDWRRSCDCYPRHAARKNRNKDIAMKLLRVLRAAGCDNDSLLRQDEAPPRLDRGK